MSLIKTPMFNYKLFEIILKNFDNYVHRCADFQRALHGTGREFTHSRPKRSVDLEDFAYKYKLYLPILYTF